LPKATQSESGGRAGKRARLFSARATLFLQKIKQQKKGLRNPENHQPPNLP